MTRFVTPRWPVVTIYVTPLTERGNRRNVAQLRCIYPDQCAQFRHLAAANRTPNGEIHLASNLLGEVACEPNSEEAAR